MDEMALVERSSMVRVPLAGTLAAYGRDGVRPWYGYPSRVPWLRMDEMAFVHGTGTPRGYPGKMTRLYSGRILFMSGRSDQDYEPWDRSSNKYPAASNGSGKQRAIPRRPRNMAHLDTPPVTPRVGRPKREAPPPKRWRRRLIIWSIVLVFCCIAAYAIGYAAYNFFAATNATAGAAVTANDFLTALKDKNYTQAYNDLDATITVQTAPDDFTQQAQKDDTCYGPVTDYNEVANSAVQNSPQSYTYEFSITRSKLAKPYTLKLVLQQGQYGDWKISNIGTNNDLGPGQPPCG